MDISKLLRNNMTLDKILPETSGKYEFIKIVDDCIISSPEFRDEDRETLLINDVRVALYTNMRAWTVNFIELIDYMETNNDELTIFYHNISRLSPNISECYFRFYLTSLTKPKTDFDSMINSYEFILRLPTKRAKSEVDIANYNRLLSVIENRVNTPIETLTDGVFKYL